MNINTITKRIKEIARGELDDRAVSWLIRNYSSPALVVYLMDEVDELYNCGAITGQSSNSGYPWEYYEGREFCESVSRLVEGVSEEEVQEIRGIAEVVFSASRYREEIRRLARLSRFSHLRPILRITPRTLEEWKELGSLCVSVLQEIQQQPPPGVPYKVMTAPDGTMYLVDERPMLECERRRQRLESMVRKIQEGRLPPSAIRRDGVSLGELSQILAKHPIEIDGQRANDVFVGAGNVVYLSRSEELPSVLAMGKDGLLEIPETRVRYVYTEQGWELLPECAQHVRRVQEAVDAWKSARNKMRELKEVAAARGYQPGWVYYELGRQYGTDVAKLLLSDPEDDEKWLRRWVFSPRAALYRRVRGN